MRQTWLHSRVPKQGEIAKLISLCVGVIVKVRMTQHIELVSSAVAALHATFSEVDSV